jgi:2-dehydro-3-deoxyglucarate aldolase
MTIPHPVIPELLAPAGFDWITIDMEHSSIEINDLVPLLISIERQGMSSLIRVGENDPNLIKRVMDAGADGVIVANVKSAAEARQAVASVKYPPIGERGVGLYRAQRYGAGFEDYLKWCKEESVVIVQIEHVDAEKEIDDIFTTEGVDGFMVGPYDLSGSMGSPGNFEDEHFKTVLNSILEAGHRHNLPSGMHSVSSCPEDARSRKVQGFRFLAFSLDSIFLMDAARNAMSKLTSDSQN